jgi:hypothetical protein
MAIGSFWRFLATQKATTIGMLFPRDCTSLSGAPLESVAALLQASPLLRRSKHIDESAMNSKAAGLGF